MHGILSLWGGQERKACVCALKVLLLEFLFKASRRERLFSAVIKMLVGLPAGSTSLSPGYASESSFLLMRAQGSSGGQFKNFHLYHPHGRLRLGSRLLGSTWVSLSC